MKCVINVKSILKCRVCDSPKRIPCALTLMLVTVVPPCWQGWSLVKLITAEWPAGSVRESLGGPEDRKGSTECKQYSANSDCAHSFFSPPKVHGTMKSSDHGQSV